jgi:hypothetical protein
VEAESPNKQQSFWVKLLRFRSLEKTHVRWEAQNDKKHRTSRRKHKGAASESYDSDKKPPREALLQGQTRRILEVKRVPMYEIFD